MRTTNGRAAMKVCARSADIALEWALLEKLSPASVAFPRPMFIDDEAPSTYFYVMEWVPGDPLHQVLPRLTPDSLTDAVEQILWALSELHATGHAFCDLKPENVLISTSGPLRVRFVDVGGITRFGRSVRQFTPYYDRAFWGLGSRRAEPAYDLIACSLAILFSLCGAPPASTVNKSPIERQAWLDKTLKKFPYSTYIPLLHHVFHGTVSEAHQMREKWKQLSQHSVRRSAKSVSVGPARVATPSRQTTVLTAKRRTRKRDWTEWLMWATLGTAATVTLTAWATFLGWFGP